MNRLSPQEKEVAKLLFSLEKERAKKRVKEIEACEASSLETQIRLKSSIKELEDLLKKQERLVKEKEIFESMDRGKKVKKCRETVFSIKECSPIEKIEVDASKRLVVTTKPLFVKKTKWKEPRLAGVYQIRIDFSTTFYTSAIRILNITQRYKDEYDAPCINNTNPCFGNIKTDIEQEFKNRDVVELVGDICRYIVSPSDADGYIRHSKSQKKDKGWEEFLDNAVPVPVDFTFETWQTNQTTSPMRLDTDGYGSISIGGTTIGEPSEISIGGGGGGQYWTNITSTTTSTSGEALNPGRLAEMYAAATIHPPEFNWERRPRSEYQHSVLRCLIHMGLTERAANYFLDQVQPEGQVYVDRLQLEQILTQEYQLRIIRFDGSRESILINHFDLTDEMRNQLLQQRMFTYVVPRPLGARWVGSLDPVDSLSGSGRDGEIHLGSQEFAPPSPTEPSENPLNGIASLALQEAQARAAQERENT